MAFTNQDDINILQSSDIAVVGAGAGNDRYVVTAATLTAGKSIQISDTQGTNTLQLVGGLVITSSIVGPSGVLLTLNNGATIEVLGANNNFTFLTGGDPLSGTGGTSQTFSQFVTQSLGIAAVPTTGTANGTSVTVNANGGTTAGGGGTPNPGTPGQTIALTAGSDVRTGTANNDTFDGQLDLNTQLQRLNSGDNLNGGEGNDTVIATLTGGVVAPTLTSVEAVVLNNISGGGTSQLDLANATGVTSLTVQGSASALTLNNVASTTAVSIENTNSAVTLGYSGVNGGADARTLNVSNVTGAAVISANGVEAITVNAVAGNNSIALVNNTAPQATSITLTGAGALTLAGHGAATINGSAATGALALTGTNAAQTISGGTGNDTIDGAGGADVVNAGNGADRVVLATEGDTSTVNGGDGTDFLQFTALNGQTLDDAELVTTRLSNIEGVRLVEAAGLTVNAGTNFQTLGIGNITLANGAQADTVNLTSALYTRAANVVTDAGVDNVSFSFVTGGAHAINTATSTVGAVENEADTITVQTASPQVRVSFASGDVGNNNVNDTVSNDGLQVRLQQQDAAGTLTGNVVRTDDEGVVFTGASFNVRDINTGANRGVFNRVELGVQGNDAATAGGATNVYINGGQGNDMITGSAGNDFLVGGQGNDGLTTSGGNDSVLGGDGNDAITAVGGNVSLDGGAGNDVVDVTGLTVADTLAGGDGTDTLRINAAITAGDLVNVSGFELISLGAANSPLDLAQLGTANAVTQVELANNGVGGLNAITNAAAAFTTITLGAGNAATTAASLARLINTQNDTLAVSASTAGNKTVALTLANEDVLNLSQGALLVADTLTVTLAAAGARDLDTINVTGSQATTTISIADPATFSTGTSRTVTVSAATATGGLNFNNGNTAITNVALNVTGSLLSGNGLNGGAGNDTLIGGNGADNLTGNLGADVVTGGLGTDRYLAGIQGNNTELDGGVEANGGIDGIVINLGAAALSASDISTASGAAVKLAGLGTAVASDSTAYLYLTADNSLQASDNRDTLSGIENVTATGGRDLIVGSAARNQINAGAGQDTISAGGGDDEITLTVDGAVDQIGISNNAAANGQGVAAGAVVIAGANVANGDTFSFPAYDSVINFLGGAGGDTLDVVTAANVGTNLVGNVGATTDLATGATYIVYGSLNVANGMFTVANNGTFDLNNANDALLMVGGAAVDTVATHTGGLVLLDLTVALAANNFV